MPSPSSPAPRSRDDLNALQQSLWRFRMVASEAHAMLRGFDKTGDVAKVLNEDLLFSLCNQALIVVYKFLEIWDDFGSLAKDSGRVRQLRGAVQPYVDRIRIWKGLEQFRNTALAHPYKNRSGQLVGPWELIEKELAPSYHAETVMLLHLVHIAVMCILTAFPDEYAVVRPLLASPNPNLTSGPGITLGTEIQPTIAGITKGVEAKLEAMGVMVGGAIAAEFISEMGH